MAGEPVGSGDGGAIQPLGLAAGCDWDEMAARYRRELGATAEFWARHSPDREHGGYFTMLARDGAVYDTDKYMWLQWRNVYMFATLHRCGHGGGDWLGLARLGYDFLVRHGKAADGSYYFVLRRDGTPATAPYSIYSDCFAAMGAAALHQATGEAAPRHEAQAAMASYLRRLGQPKGPWEKGLPGRRQFITLGHHMMLANLGEVMAECLGSAEYEADARASVATVLDRFWHPGLRVVFENVGPDGTFDLDSCDGRHLVPGHGLEAMWFIMRHAERQGRPDLVARAAEATLGLLEFAWDREHGGLYYFMDAQGQPHPELSANMKLWWVHNEALVAALHAYRLTRRPVFREWFARLDAWAWAHFPDPGHGEWFGYLDRRGEPVHHAKGGRWKTFFHLPRCLRECLGQFAACRAIDAEGCGWAA